MRDTTGPTYADLIKDLKRTLTEDVEMIRHLVVDEDSSCPARQLRSERMRAFEYVLSLLETYETWEW